MPIQEDIRIAQHLGAQYHRRAYDHSSSHYNAFDIDLLAQQRRWLPDAVQCLLCLPLWGSTGAIQPLFTRWHHWRICSVFCLSPWGLGRYSTSIRFGRRDGGMRWIWTLVGTWRSQTFGSRKLGIQRSACTFRYSTKTIITVANSIFHLIITREPFWKIFKREHPEGCFIAFKHSTKMDFWAQQVIVNSYRFLMYSDTVSTFSGSTGIGIQCGADLEFIRFNCVQRGSQKSVLLTDKIPLPDRKTPWNLRMCETILVYYKMPMCLYIRSHFCDLGLYSSVKPQRFKELSSVAYIFVSETLQHKSLSFFFFFFWWSLMRAKMIRKWVYSIWGIAPCKKSASQSTKKHKENLKKTWCWRRRD